MLHIRSMLLSPVRAEHPLCLSHSHRRVWGDQDAELAPVSAGIANKKEILLESILVNLKILAAVIVIPALLTPGIKASI